VKRYAGNIFEKTLFFEDGTEIVASIPFREAAITGAQALRRTGVIQA